MLNGLQPWHIVIILLVLVVLFGAKRLPDAARGIGKSMRIFKAEAAKLHDEDENASSPAPPAATTPTPQITQQPTAQVAPPLEQTLKNEQQQH